MPASCASQSFSSHATESSAVTHSPSSKYSFLVPGLSEDEYRERFVKFICDLDVDGAEKLSEGAFGVALRCKKVGTGETYILKKIKNDCLGSSSERREACDQLKAECRLTLELSLQSPYVIQGLGWVPQHGMLLEHATLGSIRQLMSIREKPLPTPVIFHLISSLIKGLASVHEAGYLHLDMKPANIFVHGDGRIVIGDFGLSAPLHSRRPGVAGSPRFMSCQQLKPNVLLTREMDWYATAAIMVEFLDDGSTMFANVRKADPIWSAGNIVNTVTKLHLRNAYHTPKILTEFNGGLLLLEALRDGVMDPVELLECTPLSYGSPEAFFNWAIGRRTPRFMAPPVPSNTSSVCPSPVHAVSSRTSNPRQVYDQRASSPYHHRTLRSPLHTSQSPNSRPIYNFKECSPLDSLVPSSQLPCSNEQIDEIGNEENSTFASGSSVASVREASHLGFEAEKVHDQCNQDVDGRATPSTTNSMDISPSDSSTQIPKHADVVGGLTGCTAVHTTAPSTNVSVVDERTTTSSSISNVQSVHGLSENADEPQCLENATNLNQCNAKVPRPTPPSNEAFTNQNEKDTMYGQVPTIAALAAEAATFNTPALAKPTSAHIKMACELRHVKSEYAMFHDDLHDPLYSGHQIRLAPLPTRRPVTLMDRLARVWRRFNGPSSPYTSSQFLGSSHQRIAEPTDITQQYTAISIDTRERDSNVGTIRTNESSPSFGNYQHRPYQGNRPFSVSPLQ